MRAQTDRYWSGDGGNSFISTAGNWFGNVNPNSGDNLYFNNSGADTNVIMNYGAGNYFNYFIIYSGSGGISVTGDKTYLNKLENSTSADRLTFIADLSSRESDFEINPVGSGGILVSNVVMKDGLKQLKVYGGNTLTVAGVISMGASTNANTLAIFQSSTVVFQAANTYSGITYVYSGTLSFEGNGSAKDSEISLGDTSGSATATVKIASSVDLSTTNSKNLVVASGSSGTKTLESTAASGTATVSRNIYLNDNLTTTSASGGTLSVTSSTFDLKNQTLTVTGSGNTTISSALSQSTGNGKLTKSGSGTLTLSGANSYTGGTLISAGTLRLGAGAGAGTLSTGNVTNNATFLVDRTGDVTVNNVISGTGALNKSGSGTLVLGGNNSYSGATAISNGAIRISHANALGGTGGSTTVSSGAALELSNGITTAAEALSLDGTGISSGGALRNISGNNTYAGAITLAGSAQINSDSGTLTLSGGISGAQNLTIGGAGDVAVSSAIGTGAGALTKSGNGALTLSANNTYTGGTLISAGTLQLGSGGTTGSLSTGNITNNATFLVNRSDDITVNNIISGTGALNKTGAGTLTLGGVNTYTGKTTISNGAISVSAASGLGGNPGGATADQVTLNGGRLNVTSGFTANANAGITIGASGGTIDIGTSQTLLQGGGLSGGGALTKTGAGTLALTNTAGNYIGTITLTNGGLKVNTSLGSATVSVGSTVSKGSVLSGAGTLGAVTINSGGLIAPGNSPGTLSVSSLTLNGGGGYQWEVTDATGVAGTGWDVISVGSGTGTVTVGATSGNQFTIYVTGNNPSNFNSATNYTWAFIDSQTVSGFAANAFAVDTSAFTGYSGSLGGFAVSTNSSGDVTLVYTGAASAYDVTVGASTATAQGSASGGAAQFTGASALNKLGAGTLIMTNSANDYTGVTTVKEGTIQINVNAPNGSAGALGNATTAVLVGDSSTNLAAGFNLGAANVTNGRALSMVAGTGSAERILSTSISSGTAEQAGNVALNTNATFSAASGGNLLVSGVVSGSGALTKNGAGTLTLSGNNTFSGVLTVAEGKLTVDSINNASANGVLGSSTNAVVLGSSGQEGYLHYTGATASSTKNFTAAAGGTAGIEVSNSATTLTLSGVIDGSGGVTKGGAGILYLTGENSFSGALNIHAGTWRVDGPGSLGSGATAVGLGKSGSGNTATFLYSGSTNATSSRAFDLVDSGGLGIISVSNSGTALTLSGIVSGSGRFEKAGAGTLVLSGNNSYSGTALISAGTLSIGAGGTTGSLGSSTITNNATLLYNRSDNLTQGTAISGSGVLVKTNTGVLTLTAANTQSGGTLIAGGTLSIGGGGTTGSLAGAITNNATLLYNRSDNLTQGTVISGTGALDKAGGGTLTLSQANTYTGATTISNGAINVQNNTGLGTVAGGVTVISGAALELQGGVTIGAEALSLNGTGLGSGGALRNIAGGNTYSGAITLGSASRINSDAGTLTLSGGITGTQNLTIGGAANTTVSSAITTSTGTLTKDGAGTATLSGANTFTGNVTISAGTLAISGGSALADTVNVNVASGANFAVNGSETIAQLTGAGATTLAASQALTSSFNSASAAYSGTFSGTGGITKTGSGTLTLSGNSSGYSGATTLNNGTFLIGSDGAFGTGTVTINYDTGTGTRELASSGASAYTLNNDFNLYYNSFSLGQSSGGTGSLTLGGSGKSFSLGADGVSTTRTITVNGIQTIAANVSGGANNNLNKAGNGTLILSGDASGIGGTITNSAGRLQIGNGSTTGTLGSKNVTLSSGADLAFNRSDNLTYGGSISGSGGTLTKLGSGTLTLTGVSTYTGTTTISNGTLAVTNGAVISDSGVVSIDSSGTFSVLGSETIGQLSGSGAVSIASGQSLTTTFDNSAVGFSGAVSGSGALTKGGTGTLTLSGSNNFSGGTAVSTGAVVVGNDWALGSTNGSTTVSSGAALQLSNVTLANEAISVTGTGVGSTGVLMGYSGNSTSLGLLTLSGNNVNTYVGAASGATLTLSNVSGGNNELWVVGDGSTTIAGGATNSGATALVKTNTGTLVLAASNAWSGNEYIRQGTVVLSNNNALGTAGTTFLGAFEGSATATLQFGSGITNSNALTVEATGTGTRTLSYQAGSGSAEQRGNISLGSSLTADVASGGSLTASGDISGANALTKSGGGTFTLSGNNTYSGATTIAGGTLRVSGNNRLGNTSTTLTISNAGVLEVTSAGRLTNAITIGAGNGVLSNSSGGALVIAGGVSKNGTTFTSRSGTGTNVFTGVISGASANSDFVVDGGTTVFSNAMTYNGPTIITNGGTLVLGTNNAVPTSSGLVLGGGTFIVGNSSTHYSQTLGTLTLTENSVIDLGSYSGSPLVQLTFANSSAISWVTGKTLTISNWQGVAYQSSDVAEIIFGTGGLTSTQLGQIYFANQNINGGTLNGGELVPIPEPRVYAAALALVAAVGWRERRRLLGLLRRRK